VTYGLKLVNSPYDAANQNKALAYDLGLGMTFSETTVGPTTLARLAQDTLRSLPFSDSVTPYVVSCPEASTLYQWVSATYD